MASLVSSFNHDSDLNTCHIPVVSHDPSAHDALLSSAVPTDINTPPIAPALSSSEETADKEQDVPKKPGISRSTYFRAKRNLKSHGSVRCAPSGKQIGRPQKLNADAEQLIQCELTKNPAAELKHLQTLVSDKCGITVSLSSISRRLKALGCSPSQNPSQPKRASRKKTEDPLGLQLASLNALQHDTEYDAIPQLEDYELLQNAFVANIHDSELSAYHSNSGMSLSMLDMQSEYADLSHSLDSGPEDAQHMYKYHGYDREDDLGEYPSGLNQDLYQHADHERQMLFNDPDLGIGSNWQEV